MTDGTGPRRMWTIASAFAISDLRILWRMRMPLVFMFVVPVLLSGLLGPAISGDGTAPPGRFMIGFAVLFSFMTINYVGIALFREFVHNTWTRQAIFRPPRIAFLLGKLVPVVGFGFVQLTVLGAMTFLSYQLPLHGNVLQLLAVAAALSWSGPLIGIVLYNATSSTSAFQSMAYLLMLGLGGVGGAIVPPERLPAVSRALSPFTPHYWALRAFTQATVGTGGWTATAQAVGVLVGFNALLLVIALGTFDYRAEKSVLV